MRKYILGKKLGMTQMFGEKGTVIPVTVIEAGPCVVVQIKTEETDGYNAIQVGFMDIRKTLVNSPRAGVFKKANVTPKRFIREFVVDNPSEYTVGQEIKCDIFAENDMVDVTARTKGHGFTGAVKRWNQHIGPKAHGSGYHRGVGSMGANSDPSRVFKNKHMAGHYGNEKVTIQNLKVVKVDVERNCILVKGGVPGADGCLVALKEAVKAKKKGAK